MFDGLIALEAHPPAVRQLHDLELPPTAEERIVGSANEYVRVAKILLLLSPEIALIDPYLNPLKRAYAMVLAALFELAAKGKCQTITLWARSAELLGGRNPQDVQVELEAVLRSMARRASFKPGRRVELLMVEDECCQTKMHGRYLLSIKGGIRLDQGFAQLPQARQVDAGPVGQSVHSHLLDIYFDGKHNMRVADRVTVTL